MKSYSTIQEKLGKDIDFWKDTYIVFVTESEVITYDVKETLKEWQRYGNLEHGALNGLSFYQDDKFDLESEDGVVEYTLQYNAQDKSYGLIEDKSHFDVDYISQDENKVSYSILYTDKDILTVYIAIEDSQQVGKVTYSVVSYDKDQDWGLDILVQLDFSTQQKCSMLSDPEGIYFLYCLDQSKSKINIYELHTSEKLIWPEYDEPYIWNGTFIFCIPETDICQTYNIAIEVIGHDSFVITQYRKDIYGSNYLAPNELVIPDSNIIYDEKLQKYVVSQYIPLNNYFYGHDLSFDLSVSYRDPSNVVQAKTQIIDKYKITETQLIPNDKQIYDVKILTDSQKQNYLFIVFEKTNNVQIYKEGQTQNLFASFGQIINEVTEIYPQKGAFYGQDYYIVEYQNSTSNGFIIWKIYDIRDLSKITEMDIEWIGQSVNNKYLSHSDKKLIVYKNYTFDQTAEQIIVYEFSLKDSTTITLTERLPIKTDKIKNAQQEVQISTFTFVHDLLVIHDKNSGGFYTFQLQDGIPSDQYTPLITPETQKTTYKEKGAILMEYFEQEDSQTSKLIDYINVVPENQITQTDKFQILIVDQVYGQIQNDFEWINSDEKYSYSSGRISNNQKFTSILEEKNLIDYKIRVIANNQQPYANLYTEIQIQNKVKPYFLMNPTTYNLYILVPGNLKAVDLDTKQESFIDDAATIWGYLQLQFSELKPNSMQTFNVTVHNTAKQTRTSQSKQLDINTFIYFQDTNISFDYSKAQEIDFFDKNGLMLHDDYEVKYSLPYDLFIGENLEYTVKFDSKQYNSSESCQNYEIICFTSKYATNLDIYTNKESSFVTTLDQLDSQSYLKVTQDLQAQICNINECSDYTKLDATTLYVAGSQFQLLDQLTKRILIASVYTDPQSQYILKTQILENSQWISTQYILEHQSINLKLYEKQTYSNKQYWYTAEIDSSNKKLMIQQIIYFQTQDSSIINVVDKWVLSGSNLGNSNLEFLAIDYTDGVFVAADSQNMYLIKLSENTNSWYIAKSYVIPDSFLYLQNYPVDIQAFSTYIILSTRYGDIWKMVYDISNFAKGFNWEIIDYSENQPFHPTYLIYVDSGKLSVDHRFYSVVLTFMDDSKIQTQKLWIYDVQNKWTFQELDLGKVKNMKNDFAYGSVWIQQNSLNYLITTSQILADDTQRFQQLEIRTQMDLFINARQVVEVDKYYQLDIITSNLLWQYPISQQIYIDSKIDEIEQIQGDISMQLSVGSQVYINIREFFQFQELKVKIEGNYFDGKQKNQNNLGLQKLDLPQPNVLSTYEVVQTKKFDFDILNFQLIQQDFYLILNDQRGSYYLTNQNESPKASIKQSVIATWTYSYIVLFQYEDNSILAFSIPDLQSIFTQKLQRTVENQVTNVWGKSFDKENYVILQTNANKVEFWHIMDITSDEQKFQLLATLDAEFLFVDYSITYRFWIACQSSYIFTFGFNSDDSTVQQIQGTSQPYWLYGEIRGCKYQNEFLTVSTDLGIFEYNVTFEGAFNPRNKFFGVYKELYDKSFLPLYQDEQIQVALTTNTKLSSWRINSYNRQDIRGQNVLTSFNLPQFTQIMVQSTLDVNKLNIYLAFGPNLQTWKLYKYSLIQFPYYDKQFYFYGTITFEEPFNVQRSKTMKSLFEVQTVEVENSEVWKGKKALHGETFESSSSLSTTCAQDFSSTVVRQQDGSLTQISSTEDLPNQQRVWIPISNYFSGQNLLYDISYEGSTSYHISSSVQELYKQQILGLQNLNPVDVEIYKQQQDAFFILVLTNSTLDVYKFSANTLEFITSVITSLQNLKSTLLFDSFTNKNFYIYQGYDVNKALVWKGFDLTQVDQKQITAVSVTGFYATYSQGRFDSWKNIIFDLDTNQGIQLYQGKYNDYDKVVQLQKLTPITKENLGLSDLSISDFTIGELSKQLVIIDSSSNSFMTFFLQDLINQKLYYQKQTIKLTTLEKNGKYLLSSGNQFLMLQTPSRVYQYETYETHIIVEDQSFWKCASECEKMDSSSHYTSVLDSQVMKLFINSDHAYSNFVSQISFKQKGDVQLVRWVQSDIMLILTSQEIYWFQILSQVLNNPTITWSYIDIDYQQNVITQEQTINFNLKSSSSSSQSQQSFNFPLLITPHPGTQLLENTQYIQNNCSYCQKSDFQVKNETTRFKIDYKMFVGQQIGFMSYLNGSKTNVSNNCELETEYWVCLENNVKYIYYQQGSTSSLGANKDFYAIKQLHDMKFVILAEGQFKSCELTNGKDGVLSCKSIYDTNGCYLLDNTVLTQDNTYQVFALVCKQTDYYQIQLYYMTEDVFVSQKTIINIDKVFTEQYKPLFIKTYTNVDTQSLFIVLASSHSISNEILLYEFTYTVKSQNVQFALANSQIFNFGNLYIENLQISDAEYSNIDTRDFLYILDKNQYIHMLLKDRKNPETNKWMLFKTLTTPQSDFEQMAEVFYPVAIKNLNAPDKVKLAVGFYSGDLYIFTLENDQVTYKWEKLSSNQNDPNYPNEFIQPRSITLSNDGKRLFVIAKSQHFKIKTLWLENQYDKSEILLQNDFGQLSQALDDSFNEGGVIGLYLSYNGVKKIYIVYFTPFLKQFDDNQIFGVIDVNAEGTNLWIIGQNVLHWFNVTGLLDNTTYDPDFDQRRFLKSHDKDDVEEHIHFKFPLKIYGENQYSSVLGSSLNLQVNLNDHIPYPPPNPDYDSEGNKHWWYWFLLGLGIAIFVTVMVILGLCLYRLHKLKQREALQRDLMLTNQRNSAQMKIKKDEPNWLNQEEIEVDLFKKFSVNAD